VNSEFLALVTNIRIGSSCVWRWQTEQLSTPLCYQLMPCTFYSLSGSCFKINFKIFSSDQLELLKSIKDDSDLQNYDVGNMKSRLLFPFLHSKWDTDAGRCNKFMMGNF
jgi:hypothetical protein